MRQLLIGENTYAVEDNEYLNIIRQLAKGYFILSEAYHNCHLTGLGDLKGILHIPNDGQFEVIKSFEDQIEDKELAKYYHSLKDNLKRMEDLDRQMIDWLAGYVDSLSRNKKKDSGHLEERIKRIIVNGARENPKGLAWATHPEYRSFIDKSQVIFNSILNEQNLIDQRIQTLLTSPVEE